MRHYLDLVVDDMVNPNDLLSYICRHAGSCREKLPVGRSGQGEDKIRSTKLYGIGIQQGLRDDIPRKRLTRHKARGQCLSWSEFGYKDGSSVVTLCILNAGQLVAEIAGPHCCRDRRRKELCAFAKLAPLLIKEKEGLSFVCVVLARDVQRTAKVPTKIVKLERRLLASSFVGKEVGRIQRVIA